MSVKWAPYIAFGLFDIYETGFKNTFNKETEMLRSFKEKHGWEPTTADFQTAIQLLESLKLAKVTRDPLTQDYIAIKEGGKQTLLRVLDSKQAPNTLNLIETIMDNKDPQSLRRELLDVGSKYAKFGTEWISEALGNISQELNPKDSDTPKSIPASDRIVAIAHNQTEGDEIFRGIERIVKEYRADNEAGHDDEQPAVLADLTAGRTLWEKGTFHIRSLWETLMKALRYIATKFADKSIGELAKELLEVIQKFVDSGN